VSQGELARIGSALAERGFVSVAVMVAFVSYGIRLLVIVCDWLLGDVMS
jgi:hypothetical protein